MPSSPEVRAAIVGAVDEWSGRLVEISHDIHAHPELNFTEHHAHMVLTDLLEEAGLTVTRGAYGLSTAFRATAGHGNGPHVAILCEYDALEGIGHACGHNVIAAAGAGAGIAAARVVTDLGGRLTVLGTPAEEGGGGKITLIDAGAFDGIDAAMMVHPAGAELSRMQVIAVSQWRVGYRGLAAHAAAAPQLGRNALDAAVLGYMNVAALRQHIGPDERIHGIFTEAGEAANVVPERAETVWFVRSPTIDGLGPLEERVHACLRAGATAAGCEVTITSEAPTYADMIDNPLLLDRYVAHGASLGRAIAEPSSDRQVVGSTDMGNVSHIVPSIHPIVQIAPPDVAIHTRDFCERAVSVLADRTVCDAAKMLALTAADLWLQPELVVEAQAAFVEATSRIPEA